MGDDRSTSHYNTTQMNMTSFERVRFPFPQFHRSALLYVSNNRMNRAPKPSPTTKALQRSLATPETMAGYANILFAPVTLPFPSPPHPPLLPPPPSSLHSHSSSAYSSKQSSRASHG